MTDKQRTFGQFPTPPDVADLLLGFCLRRPFDLLLDPSCGSGALLERAALWQQWLADNPDDIPANLLWGVELDQETAVSAHTALPQARILGQNFFTLKPDATPEFDAIIGNPPYTRSEWIGRLNRLAGEQLPLDIAKSQPAGEAPTAGEASPTRLIPLHLWQQLGRRSGLHAYFFLHSVAFLREGGRLGFVVPNGWLDVAYGRFLKQFLLDHFRLVAVIESNVERWFSDAKINTCLVILEKCSGANRRAHNQVRLVRLKRPISDLIPLPIDDSRRPAAAETLTVRLLTSHNHDQADFAVRVVAQQTLTADSKWGLALRAPAVLQPSSPAVDPPLSAWATIQRGYTTGANNFFYLDETAVSKWAIEPDFRQPLLKSLRHRPSLHIDAHAAEHELLTIPATADLTGTRALAYIQWGEAQGFQQRRTCAARTPWYSLPPQAEADLLLPKGIWQRHLVPILTGPVRVDQQLYQIRLAGGVDPLAAAALLNSSWFALHCELHGRLNFGEGVLWLATYELNQLHLPDPRQWSAETVAALSSLFTALARQPLPPTPIALEQPERQALDSAVFDLLEISAADRTAVLTSLRERMAVRQAKAVRP